RVRTDSTEFKNKTLAKFFDEVGITQQFCVARTPQQNGVVERRNRTLVEAARTMLTFANLPSFLWLEAIATACFTQNHSIIYKCFDKTPYELINKRKPNIKFFRVFGCRCYLLNDYEDVGKLKAKRDIGVFVGYSKESAAFRIYNKRTLSEASRKDLEDLFHNFYDEYFDSSKIMKSSTMNVETSINEEVFHEVFESFQGESSLFSLNNDVQQSPKETAFLNGILKEEVYVGQPLGFVSKQYPDHVYALENALYGLKQAPRAWYDVLSQFLIESGFQKGSIDTTLFIKKGPDIMFVTCMCARYQANPNEHHVSAVKRIFRNLKGTINLGLWYVKYYGFDLTAYSDADHAGCHLDRKTKSEYVTVSGCCAQVLWMRTQLTDYGFFYDKVPIYCYSKSAIAISCNPV
nr:integrase, catalytic region, zinc finger, CCHC-type, peptidase aspartic, catalytic [Tanacetum cinerariifolium]